MITTQEYFNNGGKIINIISTDYYRLMQVVAITTCDEKYNYIVVLTEKQVYRTDKNFYNQVEVVDKFLILYLGNRMQRHIETMEYQLVKNKEALKTLNNPNV